MPDYGEALSGFLAGVTPPIPKPVVDAGLGLGDVLARAVMAPGNALKTTPENPATTGEMIEPVADLAQIMIGTPGGAGGLGSGIRRAATFEADAPSFVERMQAGKDLEFARAQRGQGSGNYGMSGKRTAPDAAKGSFDRLADETRAGFQGDKHQIMQEYRRATGTADTDKMLLAPGETLDDMAIFSGGNKKAGSLAAANEGIRAYHGSPHDFDRFDLSKIGTGEGAQVYGHGLYFAENPRVAEEYKHSLARQNPIRYEGKPIGPDTPYDVRSSLNWLNDNRRPGESVASLIERRIKELEDHANFMRRASNPADRSAASIYDHAVDYLRGLDQSKISFNPGRTYEVSILAKPEQFLDWDKPLKGQSVADTLGGLVPRWLQKPYSENVKSGITGGNAYRNYFPEVRYATRPSPGAEFISSPAKSYDEALASVGGIPARVREVVNPQDSATSRVLRDAGVPGIRYLDQGSRGAPKQWDVVLPDGSKVRSISHSEEAANEALQEARRRHPGASLVERPGTSNYVVFDDSLIDILKKYGLAGLGVMGTGMGALDRPAMDSSDAYDQAVERGLIRVRP